jgi:hypothetical protein
MARGEGLNMSLKRKPMKPERMWALVGMVGGRFSDRLQCWGEADDTMRVFLFRTRKAAMAEADSFERVVRVELREVVEAKRP